MDMAGSILIRSGGSLAAGGSVGLHPGNITDPEYYLRYLNMNHQSNPHNEVKLTLPGAIPRGSKFHYCMKGTQREQNRDDCKGSYKSESMFWRSKVLGEWRKLMNLPPRLQELRMWANRLHLYGTDEELKLQSAANHLIAGLPIPVDQMPAEEQLMMLGVAKNSLDAALMVSGGGSRPPPQLYSAPDPEEDPEAQRAMENLATLALQAQNVMFSGNILLNATQAVLNHTRDFFLHGVLPMAGLDELDEFLLKKIGMLAHCGFENDMKITFSNVTKELMCAMRVHLMNETEIHTFCPKEARPWEDNCHAVEFANYTAISEHNEMSVIKALGDSIQSLLAVFPSTLQEDRELLLRRDFGSVVEGAVVLRMREKQLLYSALQFLQDHEEAMRNGTVVFQLEEKARQRVIADLRLEEHRKFMAEVQERARRRDPLAAVEVDLGPAAAVPKVNLTLEEGQSLSDTVAAFCKKYGIGNNYVGTLEKALRERVVSPKPLAMFIGVVIPSGERKILGIVEGSNATVETGVFCARCDIENTDQCDGLLRRVSTRLATPRRILAVLPIDAPDTRKLQLVVREGEQHDLRQLSADFLEFYGMPSSNGEMLAQEIHKRLPAIALQIPVALGAQRQVSIRLSLSDNITATVDGFVNYFDIDEPAMRLAITRRALHGMAPGTYLV